MKHSWQEKLDERGLRFIDACARLRRVLPPPTTLDVRAWHGWIKQQNAILFSCSDDLEPTRPLKLNPKFLRLYHRANPLTGLNEQELRLLLEQHGIPVSLADKLELSQRIALALEADPNLRIEVYVAVAEGILLLRRLFSGVMKKQFGTKVPERKELLAALAQNLKWIADGLRGDLGKPPGRLNIELASLTNAILAYQKKPLTQVELYAALQAARAELPRDPEAFRLWLHRARKQGLVTKLRGSRSRA
jgi:hypothetical protein